MKQIFLFCLMALPFFLTAQVVNTEKLRAKDTDKAWISEIDVTLGLTRNKAGQTFRVSSRGRIEYFREKSKWLFFGGYALTQFTNVDVPGSVPKNFANNGFSHLRYNKDLSPFITWEAFGQGQHDEIQQVDLRILLGTGPRFQLVQNDSIHLYMGLLYMYEYEHSNEEPRIDVPGGTNFDVFNRDHRISTYVSFAYAFTSFFTINHVSYFQPQITDFSDFRISSETTFNIKVTDRIALNTYFQLIYDEEPPFPVPNRMFQITNGLSLSF